MIHSRTVAADIWTRAIKGTGWESSPLSMKWYALHSLKSDAFLHTTGDVTDAQGIKITSHFSNNRVTEMFRRLVMFFQSRLEQILIFDGVLNPAAMSFGATMVSFINTI